jgi:addiction module RelE/StbE family toxin
MPRYAIHLKPSAMDDLDRMKNYDATIVADGIERFLAYEPMRESRSRIKRLRGTAEATYRLRIEDYRVFYRVDEEESRVNVLRILRKDETVDYYEEAQR